MESKVSFLASIFFSARRFISSLTLYFRSSHTDRFVAKFLKNFFCLPLGATRFGILHKSEPLCKFRYFLSVPCSLASFVRFLFRSLAARGRIISAFSILSNPVFPIIRPPVAIGQQHNFLLVEIQSKLGFVRYTELDRRTASTSPFSLEKLVIGRKYDTIENFRCRLFSGLLQGYLIARVDFTRDNHVTV